jgi:hypothetical protein
MGQGQEMPQALKLGVGQAFPEFHAQAVVFFNLIAAHMTGFPAGVGRPVPASPPVDHDRPPRQQGHESTPAHFGPGNLELDTIWAGDVTYSPQLLV